MATKNTILTKKDDLDKFYTKPEIATKCFNELKKVVGRKKVIYLEPSAGNGALVRAIRKDVGNKVIALDLAPEKKYIAQQDFLEYEHNIKGNTVVFGNPPFGKCCNLAIKFFNKCASFDNVSIVSFIIPKTFRKDSIQKRLHANFHLVKDVELPKNSFLLKGSIDYDVPCCFQIWVRKPTERVLPEPIKNNYVLFVDKEEAEIAIRRVGSKAGKLLKGTDHNPSTTYFCKPVNDSVVEALGKLDLTKIVNQTVGVRSLAKNELIEAIAALLGDTKI